MKYAIGCVVAAIIVFFAVPIIVTGNPNACQALEQRNVAKTASNIAGGSKGPIFGVINSIGQAAATGQVTSAAEANAHPNTPSDVSCTLSIWKTL